MLPALKFQPALHVNYQESVLRIKDGLPKMKDFPKEFGGSGAYPCRNSCTGVQRPSREQDELTYFARWLTLTTIGRLAGAQGIADPARIWRRYCVSFHLIEAPTSCSATSTVCAASAGDDRPFGAVNGLLHTVLQMIEEGATHLGVATITSSNPSVCSLAPLQDR